MLAPKAIPVFYWSHPCVPEERGIIGTEQVIQHKSHEDSNYNAYYENTKWQSKVKILGICFLFTYP